MQHHAVRAQDAGEKVQRWPILKKEPALAERSHLWGDRLVVYDLVAECYCHSGYTTVTSRLTVPSGSGSPRFRTPVVLQDYGPVHSCNLIGFV